MDIYKEKLKRAGSEEDVFDAIMEEAERVYLRFEKDGNPYSFHKAFEFAVDELKNWHNPIPEDL